MVAPSVGSVGTPTNPNGSTTAVSIPVPASVVSGSIVLVVVHTGSTSSITGFGTTGLAHAPGSPLQSSAGGGNFNVNVLWKRASGADSGTYALTQSAAQFWTGGSARIDNAVASGSPWDTASGTGSALNTSASSASLTTSLTTGGADELLFNAAGQFNGGTWTQPTGFTKDFTDTAAPGIIYFSHKAQAVAGGTGTLTTTCSGGASQMADWLGALLPVAGGTLFTISPTGASTPAGALAKQVSKMLAGTSASSSALAKLMSKALAGTSSMTGTLTRLVKKSLTGSSGSSGALTRLVSKSVGGVSVPTGVLKRQTGKSLAGSSSSTGVISNVRVILRTFTGSSASSGALTRLTGKALTSLTSPVGTLVKLVRKSLTATSTPSGAESNIKSTPGSAKPGRWGVHI
jgi:hypothetical protein